MLQNGIRVALPESTYDDGRSVGCNTAAFIVTAEYTNYTQSDLYVKTQSNIPFVIEPNTSAMSTQEARPHLEVKLTYKLQNNASITATTDLLASLVANEQLLSTDAEKLQEKLLELFRSDARRTNKMNFVFTVYRRILEDELSRTAAVYFRECDLMLSLERSQMTTPHPNSSLGLQQADVQLNRNYANQSGIFVKIVDNARLAEVRYYYAGKQLISVPSTINSEREDGVYYTVTSKGDDGALAPVSKYLTFEEAKTVLGLYQFKEYALSHGNPEILLKAEDSRNRLLEREAAVQLQSLKSENDVRSAEIEGELMQLRRDNAMLKESIDLRKSVRDDSVDENKKQRETDRQRDEQIKALQLALLDLGKKSRDDDYDRRSSHRKDYYEDRSYDRKDTSEMIKFIPAVLVGALGAFAFVRTRTS